MMVPMGCLSLCISQRWSLERDHCLDFFFRWCTSLLLVGKPCLISHRDGSCLSICPSPLQNISTERLRIILTPFIVLTNCLFWNCWLVKENSAWKGFNITFRISRICLIVGNVLSVYLILKCSYTFPPLNLPMCRSPWYSF